MRDEGERTAGLTAACPSVRQRNDYGSRPVRHRADKTNGNGPSLSTHRPTAEQVVYGGQDATWFASSPASTTASPAPMTQHSDASSDHSEVSVTPPPPVSKMIEFAASQQSQLSFLNLEHRGAMLAAPLAALHTMTEMKAAHSHMFPATAAAAVGSPQLTSAHQQHMHQQHAGQHQQQHAGHLHTHAHGGLCSPGCAVAAAAAAVAAAAADKHSAPDAMLERTSLHLERSGMQRGASTSPLGTTVSSNGSQGANPHGIDHILSRPSQITTGHLHFPASLGFTQPANALAGSSAGNSAAATAAATAGLRGFNIAAAAFFHHHAAAANQAAGKPPPVDISRPTATGIYWPGFQGLVANPIAWRDRLNSSKFILLEITITLNVCFLFVLLLTSDSGCTIDTRVFDVCLLPLGYF